MKSITLIFLFLVSFGTVLTAQDYGTPEERAEKMTSEMQKELPLAEEEVDTVKSLNLKYAKIIQREVIDKDLSKWSSYKKIKKINGEKEVELRGLLSESQYQNYEKMKKERSKSMLKNL